MAHTHMAKALELYYTQRHRADATLHGLYTGVACHNWVALTTWLLGYPERAVALIDETYQLAQDLASSFNPRRCLVLDCHGPSVLWPSRSGTREKQTGD